jgi:hypothetical protein
MRGHVEITLVDIALNDAKLEAFDLKAVLNFAEHVILNAERLWAKYSFEQKQRVQKLLFPEGVTFSESGFGTTATSLIFNLLQQPQPEKARMATPAAPKVRPARRATPARKANRGSRDARLSASPTTAAVAPSSR